MGSAFATKGVVTVCAAFDALPDTIVFGTQSASADAAGGNATVFNVTVMENATEFVA